jgi:hypothetical protein
MLTGTPGSSGVMSVMDMDFSGKRARIPHTPGMRPFELKAGTTNKKCIQPVSYYQAIRGKFEAVNRFFTKTPAKVEEKIVPKVCIDISLLNRTLISCTRSLRVVRLLWTKSYLPPLLVKLATVLALRSLGYASFCSLVLPF